MTDHEIMINAVAAEMKAAMTADGVVKMRSLGVDPTIGREVYRVFSKDALYSVTLPELSEALHKLGSNKTALFV